MYLLYFEVSSFMKNVSKLTISIYIYIYIRTYIYISNKSYIFIEYDNKLTFSDMCSQYFWTCIFKMVSIRIA